MRTPGSSRGLHEISRLATRYGANPLTLAGLAGMGDLVLTCTGSLSRNRTLGCDPVRVGLPEAIESLNGQVAEVTRNRRYGVWSGTTRSRCPSGETVACLADERSARRMWAVERPRFERLSQRLRNTLSSVV